jgi:hypothetical protein
MLFIKITRSTILIWLLFSQIGAAETGITPANFTHTAPITFNDPKTVAVTVRLPQWSYFASKHQLADLRVFNAEGITVAHQLTPIQQNTPGSEFSVNALGITVEDDITEAVGHSADMQLDIKGKLAIHMSESKSSKSTPKTKISQLILDDPHMSSKVINNFRFELDEALKADYEAEVAIESSEDLRTWQPVISNQKLLVYFGSHRLAQLSIAIPPSMSRYWRIRSEGADLSRIIKIYASTPAETAVVMEKVTINCQLNATKEQVFCPFKGTALPITSVQFNFGIQRVAFNALINTYRQVTQPENRASKQQPSQSIKGILTSSQATTYKLNGLPISELQMAMAQSGQLGLTSAPSVTVEWPAQQLTFLAHGSAPYTLAVGADHLDKRFEQAIDSTWALSKGSTAESKEQKPKAIPADLKKKPWLLWGLLVTAVITLAWMALSLLRTG